MKETILNNLKEASSVLEAFISDSTNISNIEMAGDILSKAVSGGGKVISCGNGGSMCDAMHFAEELTGRFRNDRISMPAVAISEFDGLLEIVPGVDMHKRERDLAGMESTSSKRGKDDRIFPTRE